MTGVFWTLLCSAIAFAANHLYTRSRYTEAIRIEIAEAFNEAKETIQHIERLFNDGRIKKGKTIEISGRYLPRVQQFYESSASELPKYLSSAHLRKTVITYNAIAVFDSLANGYFMDLKEHCLSESPLSTSDYETLQNKYNRLRSFIEDFERYKFVSLLDLPNEYPRLFSTEGILPPPNAVTSPDPKGGKDH